MVQNKVTKAASPRGRPRSFDSGAAIEGAMQVFWTNGYEGASMDRLCREMGMPRSSLYGTYAGKEVLFLAAVDHYAQTRLRPVISALAPTGSLREDLGAFFDAVLKLATSGQSRGCLISCALSDAAGANLRFRRELDRRYAALEVSIASRIRHETLPALKGVQADSLAVAIASVARGIMLRARAGTAVEKLRDATTAALELLIPR